MNVCYCTQCRKPIPEHVSRSQGICNDCHSANQKQLACKIQAAQAAQAQKDAQLATLQAQKDAKQAALQTVDTRLGVCPGCGCRNIVETMTREGVGMGCAAQTLVLAFGGVTAILFLLSFLLPFLFLFSLPMAGITLLAVVLEPRGKMVRRRTCRVCGHAWPV